MSLFSHDHCDQCGGPLGQPATLQLPMLRSRSNVVSEKMSAGVVIAQFLTVAAGTQESAFIQRPRDLDIGQLPKGSMRAHIVVRDVCFTITPNGSLVTAPILNGFLYYNDVNGQRHVIAALGYSGLAAMAFRDVTRFTLIVENAITDGAPASLGTFLLETVVLTLGTATNIQIDIRANLDVLYEATNALT